MNKFTGFIATLLFLVFAVPAFAETPVSSLTCDNSAQMATVRFGYANTGYKDNKTYYVFPLTSGKHDKITSADNTQECSLKGVGIVKLNYKQDPFTPGYDDTNSIFSLAINNTPIYLDRLFYTGSSQSYLGGIQLAAIKITAATISECQSLHVEDREKIKLAKCKDVTRKLKADRKDNLQSLTKQWHEYQADQTRARIGAGSEICTALFAEKDNMADAEASMNGTDTGLFDIDDDGIPDRLFEISNWGHYFAGSYYLKAATPADTDLLTKDLACTSKKIWETFPACPEIFLDPIELSQKIGTLYPGAVMYSAATFGGNAEDTRYSEISIYKYMGRTYFKYKDAYYKITNGGPQLVCDAQPQLQKPFIPLIANNRSESR